MSDGVKMRRLSVVSDPRGDIYKLLTLDSPEFSQFGELYASRISPLSIKAWRLHKRVTSNLTVVQGEVLLVCTRLDPKNKKRKTTQEFQVSGLQPSLITIPPNVWYGFKAGSSGALIINLIDEPHSEIELCREDPNSPLIGYDIQNALLPEAIA